MYHDIKPKWRGIYAFDDEETPEWRKALFLGFGNESDGSIPKFATKLECKKFVRTVCWRGSNPDYPDLQHIVSTLVDWNQIESILISKMEEYDRLYPFLPPRANQNSEKLNTKDQIIKRLDLPFHKLITRESSINTLKHAYEHTRYGIFVMIRRSKVVLFVPFTNKNRGHYKETSKHSATTNHSQASKYQQKQNSTDEEQFVHDRCIIQLRDMLEDSCKHRDIPDCEFLINKEDAPILKVDPEESIVNDKQPELNIRSSTRLQYQSYAPVMSVRTSESHADIPFPSSLDWESATGLYFPQTFFHSHCDACACGKSNICESNWECYCSGDTISKKHGLQGNYDESSHYGFAENLVSWDVKQNTTLFLGEVLMSDTNAETNPCSQILNLRDHWKEIPDYNGQVSGDGVPFLDAQLLSHSGTETLESNFKIQKFKYILHVEGYSAISYATLLQSDCVILKAASSFIVRELWYFPLLHPFEDHVPIRSDLSDLAEKIHWCRDNDEKCRDIAACARQAYKNCISKSTIHDYLELTCTAIAKRFTPAPKWYNRPQKFISKPQYAPHGTFCVVGQNPKYCKRCLELKEEGTSRHAAELRKDMTKGSYHVRDKRKHKRGNTNHQNKMKQSLDRGHSIEHANSEHNQIQQCRRCRRLKTVCSCRDRR